jgi:chromosomal replication initiator protein
MTTEVLRDLIRSNDRRVSIDDIQKKVSEHFDIKVSDLLSSKRSIDVARPRQIAMYLSKMLTSSSLPEIGRKFGGKDHTTVMHAVKKIEAMQKEDTAFAENVNILKRVLQV